MPDDRKTLLLGVVYDFIEEIKNTEPNYIGILNHTVHYDGTECDRFCIQDDIAAELGIERN